jgi:hypothetical protein
MPLPNRFLHHKIQLTPPARVWLVSSILIWIGLSFLLYSYAHVVREFFRLSTAFFGPREFLIFTEQEYFFYNFFYAALSLVLCFGYVSRLMFINPHFRNANFHYQKSSIINDQVGLSQLVLFIFAKVSILYGGFIVTTPIFLYFTFYDYKVILIALPVVLYVQQWSNLNRLFKKRGIKWMTFLFFGIAVLAYIFAQIPITKHVAIDRLLLQRHPSFYYQVDLPSGGSETSVISARDHGYVGLTLYIGYVKEKNDNVPRIVSSDSPFAPVGPTEIANEIELKRNQLAEYEQFDFASQIFVDKNVPMRYVKELKSILSKSNVRIVYLAMKHERAKFSTNNVFRQRLPIYCDDYYTLKVNPKAFNVNEEVDFRCGDERVNYGPALFVFLKQNKFYIDGTGTSLLDVYKRCKLFAQKNGSKGVIKLYADDVSEYGHYISVHNETLRAYRDVLDEHIMQKYGFTFREALLEYGSQYIEARNYANASFNGIIELTDSEKELVVKIFPEFRNRLE